MSLVYYCLNRTFSFSDKCRKRMITFVLVRLLKKPNICSEICNILLVFSGKNRKGHQLKNPTVNSLNSKNVRLHESRSHAVVNASQVLLLLSFYTIIERGAVFVCVVMPGSTS